MLVIVLIILFLLVLAKEIYLNLGMDKDKTSVILAGANSEIFNLEKLLWDSTEKLNY